MDAGLEELGVRIAGDSCAEPAEKRLTTEPAFIVEELLEPLKTRLAQRNPDSPRERLV